MWNTLNHKIPTVRVQRERKRQIGTLFLKKNDFRQKKNALLTGHRTGVHCCPDVQRKFCERGHQADVLRLKSSRSPGSLKRPLTPLSPGCHRPRNSLLQKTFVLLCVICIFTFSRVFYLVSPNLNSRIEPLQVIQSIRLDHMPT